jgi:hypothetical protein
MTGPGLVRKESAAISHSREISNRAKKGKISPWEGSGFWDIASIQRLINLGK